MLYLAWKPRCCFALPPCLVVFRLPPSDLRLPVYPYDHISNASVRYLYYAIIVCSYNALINEELGFEGLMHDFKMKNRS